VYCVVLDAEQCLPFAEAGFDRVLVDAPCSGTGTLRHNPEIRWRISAADIKQLAGRQRHLLLNAAKAVKPGGRLVYSTCSVETEENEEVIEAWLESHPTFDRIQLPLPLELLTESGAARTWPHRQGTDGFFIAVFERKS
jgi:16S rRNA (cytosine967-C5)-methyltransferase